MAIKALLSLLLMADGVSPFLAREKKHHETPLSSRRISGWKLQTTTTNNAENIRLDGNLLRSVASVDPHPSIPVWPTWGGGKVVPVSFGDDLHDPFLLLAHHDHWFDPRDPLRGPFKAIGKALGLPYVDVEGFSMHPHRGFDIFTYILDGTW